VRSLVIGAAAIGLGWQGWRAFSGAMPVAHAIEMEGLVLAGPAVLILVGLVLLAERRWPAVARPLLAPGHRQDAAYLLTYVFLAVPVVTLVGTGFAVIALQVVPGLAGLSAGLPGAIHGVAPRWLVVAAALVVIDGGNWLAHLFNHRVGTLWRFHALHHSQEEMSILTSFRAHPLVHVSYQMAALPLIVLGTAGVVPAPVLVGYVLLSTLPHANVRWSFGPLGRVLVSPAYHRFHHDREDLRGVNLGTVLVLWDRLAGLAVFPEPGQAPVATGLAGRPLPAEQAAVSHGVWAMLSRQLLEPFRLAPASNPEPASAHRPSADLVVLGA
jgi:sterol desaturase/sphingolipid hydroxylase (fatty acid hydroxylase superfamily)